MAFDLAQLEKEVGEATVSHGGQEIKIKYRPSVMTPKWSAGIAKAENTGDTEVLVSKLVDVLVSWDVVRGGKDVPITEEVVEALPVALIGKIFRACFDDQGEGADDRKKRIKLFILTKGMAGEMTMEHQIIDAARHAGVPPWDLAERSVFWLREIEQHRVVESEVRQELEKREERKTKKQARKGGKRRK